MAQKTFQVSIHSSERTVYDGRAVSAIVPCRSGYLGILADHAPLAARLRAGKITLRLPEGESSVIDSRADGFLEVLKNKVTILL
jgi:F-type H+-transporting ATPase subunit epsilon